MNWLRNSLIGGILIILFLLFIRWNEFQEKQIELSAPSSNETTLAASPAPNNPVNIPTTPEGISSAELSDIPEAPVARTAQGNPNDTSPSLAAYSQLITVNTDNAQILIDTKGGDIVKVALLDYNAKLNESDNPFILLNRTESHTYIAQSGLVGPNGTDGNTTRPVFSVAQTVFSLDENDDKLVVDLNLQQAGADITKRFTFNRGSHLVSVEYIVTNKSASDWQANMFGQIKRDSYDPTTGTGISMKPFLGAAITTPDTNYKKIDFDDLAEKAVKQELVGGWVAMIQHYFISAWIPDADKTNHFNLRKNRSSDIYLLGFTSESTTIAPNSTGSLSASFYAGPKNIRTLSAISPHLDLTIDFGWLWMIAKPLFFGLEKIHGWVGNWGIAIILLTCSIKLLFFYPSAMSYRSMAKMRKVQPLMAELKERYGDDRQKMSGELMKLYKKEKVNPMGGCLPVLLQMPVFLALYWTLMESVELRHSPFFLWIHDLSVRDPYFVLPLLMGATMWIQQKLNPTPPDPMQAKIMQMMPIFFTALFMMFPAGLVLYWVVNNTLSITQQYFITKKIENS
ncbi:membrane protein insertase YidC [Teredinibacter purpureus]|uniref:membrane protein insertase YidC n=1 Tax=Teredinibacter purpureus TaxID=2731756 RepID=UPI0005F7B65A|nr:membrane protein insertase YidC [Teredinibacter purpureus]